MLGTHLLGIYEKAFPADWSWDEKLQSARKLGFDYLEISIDETDDRIGRLDWDGTEKRRLHDAIRKSGVFLQSMCLSAHRRFPFGSRDSETRAAARQIMEKAVLFARTFGIRVIQLAGYDVYYEPSTPQSRQAFLEGLQWACKTAEKYQVMLSMEIMDTPFMSSITRYMEYKNNIQSPWLTVYPDIGNLSAWGNDVPRELSLGKREIVSVHLKETLAVTDTFPGKFKCVPFGIGCVDFAGTFRLLEHLGYCGPFMIEMWHEPGRNPEEAIAAAVRFIKEQYHAAAGSAQANSPEFEKGDGSP